MNRRRFVTTVCALGSAMVLSASVAVAAPGSKVTRAITNASGCGDHAAVLTEASAVKPAKKDHQDRGKHLGQNKPAPRANESEEVDENGDRPQNHGWFVSEAAHDDAYVGREHGQHVSEVARGNAGKPDAAARGNAGKPDR